MPDLVVHQKRFAPDDPRTQRLRRAANAALSEKRRLRWGLARGEVPLSEFLLSPACRRVPVEYAVQLALTTSAARWATRRPPSPSRGSYRARRLLLALDIAPEQSCGQLRDASRNRLLLAIANHPQYTVNLRGACTS